YRIVDIGRTLPADLTRDLLAEVLCYRSLYDALCKLVQDAVFELDHRGNILRWNMPAEALTGYSAQSVTGKNVSELLLDGNPEIIFSIPEDGTAHEVRFALLDPRKKRIDLRGYAVALKGEGAIEGWLVACTASRRTEEIEQLKNEFVSSVSHELKTPLAAIKAYCVTLVSNPTLGQAQREEYLGVIDQQTDRLTRLIDDLLLVTRVEAGQMLKRRVLLSLDSIMERVTGDLQYDPAVHRVEVQTNGVRVSGDPDRLVDVLTHLLDNAIKYAPAGGTVTVDAHMVDDRTVITVRDEGIGIDSDHLPFIFDRFYRVDSDLTSNVGGSGLGLFLVNALVRAHGGNVDVRSEVGAGSTFSLSLPVRE
ncbi:MAG: ATP-binding protein, partial [Candidatus Eremiobacteraeota bacterium]|nr:ATP-binding protein [Candidatus Eremiobacteraeota bacterium]